MNFFSTGRALLLAALFVGSLTRCNCRPEGPIKLQADLERDFVHVDEGWFVFGGAAQCWDNQSLSPACPAEPDDQFPWRLSYLAGYSIMNREVSNAEYLECVQAGACPYWESCLSQTPLVTEMAASLASAVCPYTRKEVALEPARDVTWKSARAYCEWRYESTGKHANLPTEAQWEKAAVGPAVDGQAFVQPVLARGAGDSPNQQLSCNEVVQSVSTLGADGKSQDGLRCAQDPAWPDENNPVYDTGESHPFSVLAYGGNWVFDPDGDIPRESFASPYGVRDLSGNVAEWVLDGLSDHCASDDRFLGTDYAVDRDCPAQLTSAACLGNRQPSTTTFALTDLCNPVFAENRDPNIARLVKGGSYDSRSWCELNPRARRWTFDPDETIGFRCAFWDQQDSDRQALCTDLESRWIDPPPQSSSAADAGQNDAFAPDATQDDANRRDSSALDAGLEDAVVEDGSPEDRA